MFHDGVSLISGLALVGALLGATPGFAQTPPAIPQLELADGTRFVGGQMSVDTGTGGGVAPRAVLRRLKGDCSPSWERVEGGAGSSCGEHPAGCLLASFGAFDPGHVVASRIRDLAFDPATGHLAVVGEVVLVWRPPHAAGPSAGHGGFVLLLDRDGFPLADAYLGPLPIGPPPDDPSCFAACEPLARDDGEQIGVRGVAFDDDGNVVVAGWRRPAASVPGHTAAPRLLVASFGPDLSSLRWTRTAGDPGDVAVDLGHDALGEVVLTGTSGPEREVFHARVAGDGTLEPVPAPAPPASPAICGGLGNGGADTLAPGAMTILQGQLQSGGLLQLGASDDSYLEIAPETRSQANPPGVELLFDFFPGAAGVTDLEGVGVELGSFYCFEATIAARGLGATQFEVMGERQLCATEEPVLHVPVTTEQARSLGFDGVNPPAPDSKLSVLVTVAFLAAPTPCDTCQTVAQEASVDQAQLDVDY